MKVGNSIYMCAKKLMASKKCEKKLFGYRWSQ